MEFRYITQIDEAVKSLEAFKEDKYLFIDTEVAVKSFEDIDFFNDKIRLIQIGNYSKIFVYDMFRIPQFSEHLKELLENKGVIGHNLKFDIKFLKTNFGIFPQIVFDTMIASQLLSEDSREKHSLSALSYRLTDNHLDKSQQRSPWGIKNLTEEQLRYAAKDVQVLREIFPVLRDELNRIETPHKATGKIHETFGLDNGVAVVEMAFVPQLADIELRGMPVDEKLLKDMLQKVSTDYQREYIDFVRRYGVDPFSPQKVTNWLTSKLGLKLPTTQKGSLSSQDSALRRYIDREEVRKLLHIRSEKKILDKLKELKAHLINGRIYTQFKQIGAPTGRMASMRPNLQNITRDLRVLFRPPEGKKLIVADYSQIELRIAAEYVNDETMIKAFSEGKDLHRFTASLILGKEYDQITKDERQMAKAINFGLIYGISPRSLMEYARNSYGVDISLKDAQIFHSRFFEVYKGFKSWHDRVKEYLKEHNKMVVYTLLGRRMVVRRFTEAVNFPVQGTGSDLLKMAVVFFGKLKEDRDAGIVNLVHDEIIVECSESIADEIRDILSESMLRAGKILLKKVPVEFEVEIVESWAEK
ncbi:MAG TPA: bifunctional 3'-5' exonuclease/DNA polymerase [Persephonella sp.]|uniref:DNA polymerase I n=1 Tax=Persephonella marina (strain DSM 14350 / EX-H1) TaxID=123214 RepID=C0QTV3_PERMH|nr:MULTISPECIES: bifunctional 3'-5' exonuclease/DNA polymerase [Persephonella]ACO03044.1 DNA polymerase I [Persephonella marina EX-H1]HCB70264.1 bifunctional 3'-5' exonuclease/DNA polymerase [Persephonella sp.]